MSAPWFKRPHRNGTLSASPDAQMDLAASLANICFGQYPRPRWPTNGKRGGAQTHTLTAAQLAAHAHANSLNDPGHDHSGGQAGNQIALEGTAPGQFLWKNNVVDTGSATTGITITNASAGSDQAHNSRHWSAT